MPQPPRRRTPRPRFTPDSFSYGVEIEFHTSARADVVSRELNRNWLIDGGRWSVGHDAGGLEIRSPVFRSLEAARRGMEKVEAMVTRLRDPQHGSHWFRESNGCGLHVHIGNFGRNYDVLRRCGLRFLNFEDVIDRMQPDYRRGNSYHFAMSNRMAGRYGSSQRRVSTWFERAEALPLSSREQLANFFNPNGRYYKLNFHSLMRHGTLEIRTPHTSLNAAVLFGQIAFFAEFFTVAANARTLRSRSARNRYTFDGLFDLMTRNMTTETREWARGRILEMNPRSADVATIRLPAPAPAQAETGQVAA